MRVLFRLAASGLLMLCVLAAFTQELVYTTFWPSMGVNFTTDGKYAVFAKGETIQQLNLINLTINEEFQCNISAAAEDIEIDPKGRWIAVSTYDGIEIVQAQTGEVIHAIGIPENFSRYLSGSTRFSPDGSHMTYSTGHEVVMLNTETWEEYLRYDYPSATAVDFSPNGNYLAIGGLGPVNFYSTEKNDILKTVECNGDYPAVNWIRFTPDGNYFLSLGFQGANGIEVRRIPDFALIREISPAGHVGDINGFALSADGKKVAYYELKWYDIDQEYIDPPLFCIRSVIGNNVTIDLPATESEAQWPDIPEYNHLVFTPDGKFLIAGGRENVQIWKL